MISEEGCTNGRLEECGSCNVADRSGLTQRAYAHCERDPIALLSAQLLPLAAALNVSVEDLVGSLTARGITDACGTTRDSSV